MSRKAPSVGTLILICSVVALLLLIWLAIIVAATFDIGPLRGFTVNLNLETKARILRYSFYFLLLVIVTVGLAWLADRYVLKTVPDGYAALISPRNNSNVPPALPIVVTLARRVIVLPFVESMTLYDLRPRNLNFVHDAVTIDRIKVNLHVVLSWQPYADDVQMVITANVQQDKVLKEMAQRLLTMRINSITLDALQENVNTLALHLIQIIKHKEPPEDCGRLYGIALLDAKIVDLGIPKELIEFGLQKKIAELRKNYGPTKPGVSAG